MPKKERWHYDKRVGLVYNVDEAGERIGPPKAPSYICRGIEPGKGPLIAAAPDMLAALEAVEWSGEVDIGMCTCCLRWKHEGHHATCLVGNAIKLAKAEGRAR